MRQLPPKFVYPLIPILSAGILLIDSFFYLVSRYGIELNVAVVAISLKSLRELFILALLLACFYVLHNSLMLANLSLRQKLRNLAAFVTANFVILLLLNLLSTLFDFTLEPKFLYSAAREPLNFKAVLFMNLIGLMSIFTLVPSLMLLKELIFYKQRRTTRLYLNTFIALIVISSLLVVFSSEPVFLFELNDSRAQNIVLSILLILVMNLLAFRNDWINYLPRREKLLYFGTGLLVYVEILLLWNFIYVDHLPAYSHLATNFANIGWHFLVIYGGYSIVKLLVYLPTARAVDRKLREVKSLSNFARMLNSELNYQKLTHLITQLTAQVLESQSTWLELLDPEEERLRVISHINLTQQQILQNPFDDLTGFNLRVLEQRQPTLINDVSQHALLRDLARWKKDARALIAAPLFSSRDQLMGIIYASKSQPYGFDTDDVSLLEGFANQTVIALENARLWKASLERERLEEELRVARTVQLRLMPQEMPKIPGVEIDTYFLTAYEVGGDYYDFIEFVDQKPGLVIGDVSGKGTSAAFYMAEFKGVIQTLARTLDNPKELACRANRIFYSTIERQTFVTAIVGKFLPESNAFHFVRAGHTPVLYCPAGGKQPVFLQPPGLGIGLDRGTIFDEVIKVNQLSLHPGDSLVLSTDGLIEARNEHDEEFGTDRLLELMRGCRAKKAGKIKEHILDAITEFVGHTPLHDDLTFIIVKLRDDSPSQTAITLDMDL